MKYDDLRAALQREPFKPFDLHTKAGLAYTIVHPENVGVSPRIEVILVRHGGERTAMIDLDAITEVTYPPAIESRKGEVP